MAKQGKKYLAVAEKLDAKAEYSVEAAISFLKDNPTAAFDETMEIAFRMGVDPSKSDQAIRSTVALPNGTGKEVRIIVFATGEAATAARDAGAMEVGFEDLIQQYAGHTCEYVPVATPSTVFEEDFCSSKRRKKDQLNQALSRRP